MDVRGYVQVERELIDSPIWGDAFLVQLYLWCKFKANFRPGNHLGQAVEVGQFIMGRVSAAESLKVTPSRLYRGIDRLCAAKLIDAKSNSKWTTITVYSETSCAFTNRPERTANEQQTDSKRTANEQQTDTIEERNNAITQKEFPIASAIERAPPRPSRPPVAAKLQAKATFPPEFERWWDALPVNKSGVKRGKAKTYGIWTWVSRAEHDDLQRATMNYAASRDVAEGFVMSPEKFIADWRAWLNPKPPESPVAKPSKPVKSTSPGRDAYKAFYGETENGKSENDPRLLNSAG